MCNIRKTAKGVLIECSNKEATEILKTNVEKKLGDNCSVSVKGKKYPKIRLVGLQEDYTVDEVSRYLVAQNQDIFAPDEYFRIVIVIYNEINDQRASR